MKVKILVESDCPALEIAINNFLDDTIEVIDIKFETTNSLRMALIMYKKK